MKNCWQDQPEQRPSFSEIRYALEQIMLEDNPYLELYDEIATDSYQFPSADAEESDDEFDLGDIRLTVTDRQTTSSSQNGLTTYLWTNKILDKIDRRNGATWYYVGFWYHAYYRKALSWRSKFSV